MMRPNAAFLALLFLLPLTGKAWADPGLSLSPVVLLDDGTPAAPEAAKPWWLGARQPFWPQGLTFGGSVVVDGAKVLRGGESTRQWPVSYLLDLHAVADMDQLFHWPGGIAYFDFQSHDQSNDGDTAVGDVQGYEVLTSPRFTQIQQLWYKQALGDLMRLKVGKIDANGDAGNPGEDANDAFMLIEHGGDFFHQAASQVATTSLLPSYPESAPGIEAFFGKDLYAGVGAFYSNRHQTFLNFSGHPEKTFTEAGGMFIIGELGARWKWGNLPGHAGGGTWVQTGDSPRADGVGMSHGAGGGYVFLDQSLIHAEGDQARDLGFFVHGGVSDKVTSPIDRSLTGGIVASGFIPGRAADSVGLMASWAHLTTSDLSHRGELAGEVYYKLQITSWASVRPAMQYIHDPGGKLPDAVVAIVRAEIDF